MAERLIVVGGDAAGMAAASQARRRRDRDDLEIVAFERGNFTSYSACGIPYWVSGVVPDREQLIARDPATFRESFDIDIRIRHEVTGIDVERREVVARDLADGREVREGFDTLVYATGAVPVQPPWARTDAAGVFGVQTLDDGAALLDWLEREPRPRRAVVIGGGYIGVEMAEALIQRGLTVDLVEQSDQPMSTVDGDMGELVADALKGIGIQIRTGLSVTGLEERDGRIATVVTAEGPMPADVVILGLGVRPNTALAEAAGLPLGPTGGLRTDRRMRVPGVPGVWAAGDCVETLHRISGMPVHVPLGTHANKQGRVAGINIGGGYATFPGVIGTAVTKVCDLEVGRTGLRERDARAAGFDFVSVVAESTNRAGYYPGARRMTVKLIAERPSGRLLGAQIVGWSEAAKRIDTLAVALWNSMTVDDMTALDLGYAPPYAPVWDPVLIAARKAVDALAGAGR
ncbi:MULTISPECIES: FAD-dependent oxidoreductase [Micromonospora]|uniref:FAD-dependent oxidoreductase n=1 Tax=Micromonospora sicca TaxID=2202420 RepID=A0A317DWL6_9ACTN|nr:MULTISPECIES: FAD-dependent oxidoreductase [unclassified Micromonospora]MBM0226161.1 FAD-dependent oxidoreductase [Micromonospora sp. ATA51]MDZ5444785.1 FAD-dependent oxidoreductase [Micromonospora sp. 4G57]MDZ5491313.1 FAD-dependent oxidoreductase [Micromonospora sp. 4G53]PWR17245.1 flavoprotein oxidoreductase [Micromonospora sp. 4G51]